MTLSLGDYLIYLDLFQIIWLIAGLLFVIVIFQILYLVFLSWLPAQRERTQHAEVSPRAAASQQAFENPTVNNLFPHATPYNNMVPATNQQVGTKPKPMSFQTPMQSAPSHATPILTPVPQPRGVNVPHSNPGGSLDVRKLIVMAGLPEQLEINLPGNEFGIGRFYNQERRVLVMFDEKSISREHTFFNFNGSLNQFFLTDKSSSYGTYVLIGEQFEPLTPEKPERIFNGDVVQFGNVVRVQFILPGETRASTTQL